VKRLLVVAVLAFGALAAGAAPAGATNECRGLQVCVRVHGPWVVVPSRVQYELSCPRGFVVGGLDAELTDRAIDIEFLGLLGSPVNPGVTTTRAALFRGTYTGAVRRTTAFRPHLGCLPATGGGSGPVPFRLPQAFPPGQPTIRRVRNVTLRPGTVHAVLACGSGERLLSSWHAVGFYTATAPSAVLMNSVRVTRATRAGRVLVTARSGLAVRGVRAVVQVGAVCGGGQ
jgi:hypothetical protein